MTDEQKKKRQRFEIRADLTSKEEQERFELLVETSGLPKADYIRRCCLDKEIKTVPRGNLLAYGELGPLQAELTHVHHYLHDILKRLSQTEGEAAVGQELQAKVAEWESLVKQVKSIRAEFIGLELDEPKQVPAEGESIHPSEDTN